MAFTAPPIDNAVLVRDLLNERTDRPPAIRKIKPRQVVPMQGGLAALGNEVTPAAATITPAGYSGPSPGNVGRREKYAQGLLKQGMDFSPTGSGSIWEPLLRNVVPAGIGGYMQGKASEDEEAGLAAAAERYKGLFAGGRTPSTEELAGFVGDEPWASEGQQDVSKAYLAAGLKGDRGGNFRPLTAEEKQAYGLPANSPAQIDLSTGKVSAIGGGGTTIKIGEGERTAGALARSIGDNYKKLMRNFDALADETSQVGTSIESLPGGGPIGRWMQTPQYQVAYSQIQNIVQMHAYATTGAAYNPSEERRKVLSAVPQLGDTPQLLQAKKDIISDWVNAINVKSGNSYQIDVSGDGTDTAAPEGTDTDDLEGIPEGAIFMDNETGKRMIKQNGKAVEVP